MRSAKHGGRNGAICGQALVRTARPAAVSAVPAGAAPRAFEPGGLYGPCTECGPAGVSCGITCWVVRAGSLSRRSRGIRALAVRPLPPRVRARRRRKARPRNARTDLPRNTTRPRTRPRRSRVSRAARRAREKSTARMAVALIRAPAGTAVPCTSLGAAACSKRAPESCALTAPFPGKACASDVVWHQSKSRRRAGRRCAAARLRRTAPGKGRANARDSEWLGNETAVARFCAIPRGYRQGRNARVRPCPALPAPRTASPGRTG